MEVEIWSDIMCPFCYIGKRRFEEALNKFENRNTITIIWKSFQLNPDLKNDANLTIHQYLANKKGWSLEQAVKMNENVVAMASNAGLDYHFEKAKVANTFNAHRLLHLAKKHNLQNETKELLLKAYFTDGKNVADFNILAELGASIGINKEEIIQMLNSNLYSDEVYNDIKEASLLGIRGVPFFLFNGKMAISGAQPVESFLEVLKKSYSAWEIENKKKNFDLISSSSITPENLYN